MIGVLETRGPWQRPVKVRYALCVDGRRRTATITAEADTYFSLPARVQVRRKTVSGFVTGRETEAGESDYAFIAYSYGRNGHLLPGIV